MEDELDDIATAKEDMVKVLDEFYYPVPGGAEGGRDPDGAGVRSRRARSATSVRRPMVLKFGKTGQFLGCSKYPECKATRPLGGQPRAEAVESETRLPQVRQAALDPREQAGREVPFVLGLPRMQGVVQHRRARQPRAIAGGDRARLREVRQADGAAPGPSGAVPGLHGLSQMPQRGGRRRRGEAGRDGQDRCEVRKVRRARWRCAKDAAGAFLGCTELSQVPRHRPGARGAQGTARRAGPRCRPPPCGTRPEDDRGRRDLRATAAAP